MTVESAVHSSELQPEAEIPINIGSETTTPTGVLLSNHAETPFQLAGTDYKTVESFWMSLYLPEGSSLRDEIAQFSGKEAKKAGRRWKKQNPDQSHVTYQGEEIEIGSLQHHALMRQALSAKCEQNPHVLEALLATGNRKITHNLYRFDGTLVADSKSIPREVFCQLWMDLREEYRQKPKEFS